jgi:hypothetical protein
MDGSGFTIWWMLASFVLGGMSGMLVMALMCLSAGLPKQSTERLRAELRGLDLNASTVV